MNETKIGTGLTILQDTRNKRGKPVRTAVEAGAEKAGAPIRMQALPYGDYCKLNPAIQWIMDDAINARLDDLAGKAAEDDLAARLMGSHGDNDIAQARRDVGIVEQWLNDRTSLIRDRFSAIVKADLVGLYDAAVETKWRIDELSQCIDDHNFRKELRMASWHNCRLLVLVITDRTHDYLDADRVNDYITEVSKYGAYLDICSEADAYKKIAEWLNAPYNYRRGMDDTLRKLTNTR